MALKEINKAKKATNIFKSFDDKNKDERKTLNSNQIDEVLERRNVAQTTLLEWKNILDQAHTYATPNGNVWRNVNIGIPLPGQNKGAPVYDLTLPIAHRRLVSKMLMGMIPKGSKWLNFVPGEVFQEDSEEFEIANRFATNFTTEFLKLLDKSKFYLATSESLSDALISTGFMTINEGTKEDPFRFSSVADALVMVEGDGTGDISGLFRDWLKMNVGRIPSIWPHAKLPSGLDKKDLVDVYECSYIDWDARDDQKYCYALITGANELLYFARSDSWPWIYFRMYVLPGESRGRGPSLDATPGAATINIALHDEIVSAAFQANPMYMASSDSAFNAETFVAAPGLVVPVQMSMGEWPIAAFPQAGNPSFTALVIEDIRQQIRELLYTEPLGPIQGPEITATEANIRYTENLESFSAMIPRIQAEFFDPVIRRCLYILRKLRPEMFSGVDPAIVDKMVSVDGSIIGLRYETPIMTARGEIDLRKYMTYCQALAITMGPEAAAATLNMEKVPGYLARNIGLDPELVKTIGQITEELNAAREGAEAAATQEQELMAQGQAQGQPAI